jgi:hypothetical protein
MIRSSSAAIAAQNSAAKPGMASPACSRSRCIRYMLWFRPESPDRAGTDQCGQMLRQDRDIFPLSRLLAHPRVGVHVCGVEGRPHREGPATPAFGYLNYHRHFMIDPRGCLLGVCSYAPVPPGSARH